MAKENRIGILQLIKPSKKYLEHSPKQAAESIRKFREFHKRWEDKAKALHFYHAIGIETFDTLAVWEVSDIGDWVVYNDEMMKDLALAAVPVVALAVILVILIKRRRK